MLKKGFRSIRFVGEAAALILAQHQQRRFHFLEGQQGERLYFLPCFPFGNLTIDE